MQVPKRTSAVRVVGSNGGGAFSGQLKRRFSFVFRQWAEALDTKHAAGEGPKRLEVLCRRREDEVE